MAYSETVFMWPGLHSRQGTVPDILYQKVASKLEIFFSHGDDMLTLSSF